MDRYNLEVTELEARILIDLLRDKPFGNVVHPDEDYKYYTERNYTYTEADRLALHTKLFSLSDPIQEPIEERFKRNDWVRHTEDGSKGIVGSVDTISQKVYVHWQDGTTYYMDPDYLTVVD